MTFEELQAMARKSRRAGNTLAKRTDQTWSPSDLTSALCADVTFVEYLVKAGTEADSPALATALADVLWSLANLADELNVDLTAAFAERHAEVLLEIKKALTALDAGEYLT